MQQGTIDTSLSPADQEYKKSLTDYSSSLSQQVLDSRTFYEDFKKRQDDTTNALIDSIEKKYEARRLKMEDVNSRYLESKRISGISAGRQRYATTMEEGLLSTEELDGQARLAEIDAEELSLVTQAKQARTEADYKMFNDTMDRLDSINKEKLSTLTNLHNIAIEADKTLEEKRKAQVAEKLAAQKQSIDTSKAYAGGVASQMELYKTAEEKSAFIDEIATQLGIDPYMLLGDVEASLSEQQKSTIDIKNIESQIANRKAGTDIAYANLALDKQQEARLSKESVAKDEFPLSSTQKSKLLAIGFDSQQIKEMKDMIEKVGIDTAMKQIDGLDSTTEQQIRSVFSGDTTEIKATEGQFLDETYFKNNISDSTLKTLAKSAGYRHWTATGSSPWSKEKQNYIEHLIKDVIPGYRKERLKDTEILKLITG
jgi:hypothetical protein